MDLVAECAGCARRGCCHRRPLFLAQGHGFSTGHEQQRRISDISKTSRMQLNKRVRMLPTIDWMLRAWITDVFHPEIVLIHLNHLRCLERNHVDSIALALRSQAIFKIYRIKLISMLTLKSSWWCWCRDQSMISMLFLTKHALPKQFKSATLPAAVAHESFNAFAILEQWLEWAKLSNQKTQEAAKVHQGPHGGL